ncbi:MAG TPA: hypothetical protein VFP84_10820 [Kofleriaceae bacterium]|nr:hypothetical protein [Kofleriaceae bacterium]
MTVASLPPPPPPPLPCIRPAEDAPAAIRAATAEGTRVAFCVGEAADQCFAIDVATGKLDMLHAPPAPAAARAARVSVTNPDLQICRATGSCTSLTPQVLPNASKLHATTNTDGTFAVVLLGDAERGKGYAEVWDVGKARRTAAFPYARGEFRCGEVDMVGDTIYLSASTCAGPAARAALYSLRGRKIANVGGKEFGSYGNAHVQVAATTWAFLEENGARLVIQDVVKGKVVKTIDTSALWTPDGSTSPTAMGNPGEHALVKLGDGRLAVIAGTPANGNVATIDPESGAVHVWRAPMCKAP